jgi:uncharacterized protein
MLINFSPETVVLIAAVLFLAGFVKGVIGFGLPAIAVGLLGLMMPPLQAAGLLLVPNIITNIWQMLSGGAFRPLLLRLIPLFVGTLAGIAFTEWSTGGKDLAWAKNLLGLTLMTYALLGLFAIRFHVSSHHSNWIGAISGILTGAMTLATGVFVIPSGPYLQAIGLEKDELVQAMGMTFFVASVGLGLALLSRGTMNATAAGSSAIALIPALGAMLLGQRLRAAISQQLFRKLFYVGMLALGAFLMMKR